MLKRVCKNGFKIYGPPYSQSEEDAFYQSFSGGPQTIYRAPKPLEGKKQQTVQGSPPQPQEEDRRS